MKTMKNIFYALAAVVLAGFVGCTKDQTYEPGKDVQGEQIYIDNSTTTFYVQTAEEKEEEAAELEKLARGLQTEPKTFEDDTQIELKVVRKGGKSAEYATTVEIAAADESELALFTFPADATVKDGSTTTMVVPVTFAEGENEVKIVIGFDITKLTTSYEYEFNAKLIDENTSYYGASSFDFVITHMVNFEFPYTDIGTITLNYDHVWSNMVGMPVYSGIKIQIHNDDLKAIKEAKDAGKTPELDYVRFLIPKLMYQLAAASIEAADDFFTEDDLESFSECNSISIPMTLGYNMAMDQAKGNEKYPHPALVNEPEEYPLFAMAGLDAYGKFYWKVGTASENMSWVSEHITNGGLEIGMLFGNTFGCTFSRTSNVFTYNTAYYLENLSNWFGVNPFTFTWDTNELEADWANYFKVDYVKDIDYTKVAGTGTYTSTAFKHEGDAQSWAQDIKVGMDATKSTQVYFLEDVYGTSTAEQKYGLAMHVDGESLTVVAGQPTGLEWNGKAIVAGQSSQYASAAEYTADGALKKLTIGLALSFEDGTVLGEYEEVYEFNAAAAGIDAFCGNFDLITTWAPKPTPLADYPLDYTSSVTITKTGDAGKVIISGLVSDAGATKCKGENPLTVVGQYDAVQNAIVIPAQFFKGAPVYGGADLAFFQPGKTGTSYVDATYSSVYSTMDAPANECALRWVTLEGGMQVLAMTKSYSDVEDADVNGFSVDVYALNSSYEWEFAMEAYATDDTPMFLPATAGGDEGAETAALKKGVASAKAIEARKVEARAPKAARTAKVKKEISLNKVINVEALVK